MGRYKLLILLCTTIVDEWVNSLIPYSTIIGGKYWQKHYLEEMAGKYFANLNLNKIICKYIINIALKTFKNSVAISA